MSVLLEMIGRGWENFLARPNGSMSLRFYVQPTMASLLALRAGIQDARQGRQGYLWAMLTRLDSGKLRLFTMVARISRNQTLREPPAFPR